MKSSSVHLFVGRLFSDAAARFSCLPEKLYYVIPQFCSGVELVAARVDIARVLVNWELGTVGGFGGSEPRIQQGPEEDPVLQRYF